MKTPEQLDALQIPAAQDVTLKELAFSYGEEPVFSGLSLTAHPGDIIGITGPVACGKSTLGRVFLCEAPYQGSVCFGGREFYACLLYTSRRKDGWRSFRCTAFPAGNHPQCWW